MQPVPALTGWGADGVAAIAAALTMLLGLMAALISAMIVLSVGWFVAVLLAWLATRWLIALRFDVMAASFGADALAVRSGGRWTATRAAAALVRWTVFLVFVLAALNVLVRFELTPVITAVAERIPHVLAALAAVVVAAQAARLAAAAVRAALVRMDISCPEAFALGVQWVITALAALMVMGQLGIPAQVVETLFTGVVAAAALAVGLAFGLGGRDTAAVIIHRWYARRRGADRPFTPGREDGAEQVVLAGRDHNGYRTGAR